jgi:hypothetical protein
MTYFTGINLDSVAKVYGGMPFFAVLGTSLG